ncbi:MAG: thioredoxin family protein [Oligoflexia bacterium]|nr:thioredoxin family protein [Oligoflexia bacterium]
MNFLVLFILTVTINAYSQDNICSIDTDSASLCDTESGYYSDEEVKKKTVNDAEPQEEIYTKVHEGKIYLYFFYSYDCPHCKKAGSFIDELKAKYPDLVVKQYEVKKNSSNRAFFGRVSKHYGVKPRGVPTIFIGDEIFTGFYEDVTCKSIIKEIQFLKGISQDCPSKELNVPMFGTINADTISLPSFTIYLGLLDGLNPCAMWVLMFLLGLMVYAKDRKRIIFLGSVFVVSSAVVYFAFMAAWLNLFLIIGYSSVITVILGVIAILMGLINVKELFFFKKGISLMIPEGVKPKLYKKARKIIYEQNRFFAIIGTVMLAVFVNFIELGCTIGLPAIYTRILSVKGLSPISSYLYMALYNIAYIIPLAIIVIIFSVSMGHYKFSEKHGKIFKLISGLLMLTLGLLLILSPELLIFT